MKQYLTVIIFITGFLSVQPVLAKQVVSITPEIVMQGEPFMVSGVDDFVIKEIFWNGKPVPVFVYQGIPRGIIGVDLYQEPGDYKLKILFTNDSDEEPIVRVISREKVEAPLGIPQKLGGNTTSSATVLVNTLAEENAILTKAKTGAKAFWTVPFRLPLNTKIFVTDSYGYTRLTNGQSIAHKGTDFRAPEGTRARSMNRGVVRIAQTFRNYGKTVVVDHGLGLQTMYMHLSKIYVNPGELVLPGQIIGLSGSTGYAEAAHLHVSVRINGISIDPMKFLALFEQKTSF